MKKQLFAILLLVAVTSTCLAVHAFSWKFWKKQNNVIKEQQISTQTAPEVLPTMNTVSLAKNQVWVGTFQLIWNDLINEIVKKPIQFKEYDSITARNLNKKEFITDDLSESAYYKKTALASPQLKKEIEQCIKEKFNEKSDILDSFDWTPSPHKYILYAILKKDFKYTEPFDKLQDDFFRGSSGNVKYFGVDSHSSKKLRNSVHVEFYNDDNDYAISLKSKQGDTIYLYRTNDDKNLADYYKDFKKKSSEFDGKKYLEKEDLFKAPIIEFKTEKEFNELCNKEIKGTNLIISKAIETIQFKMDEVGVKLKSEAGMMTMLTALRPDAITPKYFYFNDKYIIFITENGKKPYFAMKISDAKQLQN